MDEHDQGVSDMTDDTRPPQRIQLRRTKGWRKPEGAINVARPSRWGNPYTIAEMAAVYPDDDPAELRRKCVADFRGMVEGRWEYEGSNYPMLFALRRDLAGHDLACWCPLDQPCHADVLLELANA
jgi:hypothetical protein